MKSIGSNKNYKKHKTEISAQKLPDAVHKTLDSKKFTGWNVKKAYKVNGTRKDIYMVKLSNGKDKGETALKFNKDGDLVR